MVSILLEQAEFPAGFVTSIAATANEPSVQTHFASLLEYILQLTPAQRAALARFECWPRRDLNGRNNLDVVASLALHAPGVIWRNIADVHRGRFDGEWQEEKFSIERTVSLVDEVARLAGSQLIGAVRCERDPDGGPTWIVTAHAGYEAERRARWSGRVDC